MWSPTVAVPMLARLFVCEKSIVKSSVFVIGHVEVDCSDNSAVCGSLPRVVEMTGQDVEIVCGEWDTNYSQQGKNTRKKRQTQAQRRRTKERQRWRQKNNKKHGKREEGEDYNIIIKIIDIKRHPEFNIVTGSRSSQYVQNDLGMEGLQSTTSLIFICKICIEASPLSQPSS